MIRTSRRSVSVFAVLCVVPAWARAQTIVDLPTPVPIAGDLSATDGQYDAGAYYDEYVFRGDAGAVVVIDLQSSAFDTYLELEGAGLYVENDDVIPGQDLNSRITTVLPSDGTYTVIVSSYDPATIGRYTLSIATTRTPAPTDVAVAASVPQPTPTTAPVPAERDGTEGSQRADAADAPQLITIEFHGALIAPCDGTMGWDSMNECNQTVDVDAFVRSAGMAGPWAVAVAAAGGAAVAVSAPPDVVGHARYGEFGEWSAPLSLGTDANNSEDSLIPRFPGDPAFRRLRLTDDLQIVVALSDADWNANDPIGECTLTAADLRLVIANGEPRASFNCAAQSHGRILALQLSVYALPD